MNLRHIKVAIARRQSGIVVISLPNLISIIIFTRCVLVRSGKLSGIANCKVELNIEPKPGENGNYSLNTFSIMVA